MNKTIEHPMKNNIDVQFATEDEIPVAVLQIQQWANAALTHMKTHAELSIRLIDTHDMKQLNYRYRNINKSTNVLAFPASIPDFIPMDLPLIGDVVVCPAVLQQESLAQQIPLKHHWAHIITHGILHLLGYDHIEESDALIMQQHEANILAHFSIKNPYENARSNH